MKALTVKQPWASLIVEGIKDIENRTWKTNYRGRIYVHAAKQSVRRKNGWEPIFTSAQIHSVENPLGMYFSYDTSAIIGEVDIIDCVLNHSSVWAEQMEYDVCPDTGIHILRKGQKYVWNWVLANAVKYDQPILNVKGALSFWEFDKEAHL